MIWNNANDSRTIEAKQSKAAFPAQINRFKGPTASIMTTPRNPRKTTSPTTTNRRPTGNASRRSTPWVKLSGVQSFWLSSAFSVALGLTMGVATILGTVTGCGVIYPEVNTPVREPLPGQPLETPPKNVRWVGFDGADLPALSRSGHRWSSPDTMPEPYVKLFVNGEPLLATQPEGQTLKPTWKNAPTGNFYLNVGDRVKVELWDARAMRNRPIGLRDYGRLEQSDLNRQLLTIDMDSGAQVRLRIEPPRARVGYGLFYELRTKSVYVTRLFEQSPARRAGIFAGDQILVIDGHAVNQMNEGQIRTLFNSQRPEGLVLTIRKPSGHQRNIKLQQGAIYPLFSEVGVIR